MERIRSGYNYFKKLNLYVATNEDSIEEHRNQIIATRICIILLLGSLIGLVEYTSLSKQMTIVQIKFPSQSTFENLNSIYSDTLVCPCTQTLINIDNSVYVNVSYHQICSSMLINDEWISSISNLIPSLYYSLDIRKMISSQFQLIASQCHSSKIAIMDALNTLASTQLFIPTLLSRESFISQMNIIVNQIRTDAITEQQLSRYLIQTVNQQNQIPSALNTNVLYVSVNYSYQGLHIVKFLNDQSYPPAIGVTNYAFSQLCSCFDNSNCIYPSGIYPNLTGFDSYLYQGLIVPPMVSLIQIPGLQVGCMPLDSIMESTLECFYDYNCLIEIFNMTNIQPLNSSIQSNFDIDTKIGILIENLFIENWSSEKNYESFFNKCQPSQCTYSYYARGNFAFITSTIISLVGGLFISLKIISPIIVNLYRIIEKKFIRKSSSSSSSSSSTKNNSVSLNTETSYIKTLFKTIRIWISEFNLFKKAYNDAQGRRNELLTTRVYVILMIAGLIVILLYASIVKHTLTYRIETPSLDTYRKLTSEYSTLTCQCNKNTCAYSVFISLSPTFHQVCSSLFVSNVLKPYFNATILFPLETFDIREAISSYFALIGSFCSLSKNTALQATNTFFQTIYVSDYLTSEDEFDLRINASLTNFEALTPITFTHLMQLVRDTTQGNQLLSAGFSNADLQYNNSATTKENTLEILWINPFIPSCSCGSSLDSCPLSYNAYCGNKFNLSFNTITCETPIPGLYIACYLVDGAFTSTLQCVYDMNCLTRPAAFVNYNPEYFEILFGHGSLVLNQNLTSRFYVNSTVSDIMNALMIENWTENINYSLYYNNCNPISCSYTIIKRFDISTVLATILGLIGGLSVALHIILPPIIKLVTRHHTTFIRNINIALEESWFQRSANRIRNLNFFKNIETEQSQEIRHHQTISTRLYIILWITSVIILSIYTGLSQKTNTVLVNSPSMNVVTELQQKDFNELTCPCSKINIPFESFTSLNFTLHQICSSDFVSNDWLESLFNFSIEHSVGQAVLASHFKLLSSFCQISKQILHDAATNLYANQFISTKVLTQNQFNDQSKALIQDFQNETLNSFRRNLALIIDITLGNQLISIYETNWHFIPALNESFPLYTESRSYQSGNCSCGTSQSSVCVDPLVINSNTTVSGMFIGCLPLTSLRLSSLECFYDDNCLNEIKTTLNIENLSIIPLNASQSSRFLFNITLDNIIDNLMVEQWTNNINYTGYFNQCYPKQCTYLITMKNNALTIFTTLLSFYGGLTVVLQFISPNIITIGFKIYSKCRPVRRITPELF